MSGEEGDEEEEEEEREEGEWENDEMDTDYILNSHRNISSSEIRRRWEGRGSGWNNDSGGGGGGDSPRSLPKDQSPVRQSAVARERAGKISLPNGGWGFGPKETKVDV